MTQPLHIVVHLYRGPAGMQALHDWERQAVRILETHGGRMITAFKPSPQEGEDTPDEIHVIAFDDATDFERYRADPALARLASARVQAIARTQLFISERIVDYR